MPDQTTEAISQLRREIIVCRRCPRLVAYREKVARERKKQYANFEYWGRPVPGFGDHHARLLVVGLAPAAHGGNRTGRVFTGDNSARFLVRHLYNAGFANQPISETRDDGLQYKDCYVTAALRCVPPDNKPTAQEMENCAPFLERELLLLENVKAILALGKIAFDAIVDFARGHYAVEGRFRFEHGKRYKIADNFPVIFASYHPSPRNTNTGKMTSAMFARVLRNVNKYLDECS